jgi:hypothetical protein
MEKRVFIVAIAVLLCFAFVIAEGWSGPVVIDVRDVVHDTTTPTVTTPALASGQSVIYYLRALNKEVLLKASTHNLSSAEKAKADVALTEGVKKAKTVAAAATVGKVNSSKINTYVWKFNEGTGAKSIIFPKVTSEGKTYENLMIIIVPEPVFGFGTLASVYLGDSEMDCGENSTFFGKYIDGWQNVLNLTLGQDRVCDARIKEEPIAILNLNRFVESGKNELSIKSPLVPDGTCTPSTSDGKIYILTCP